MQQVLFDRHRRGPQAFLLRVRHDLSLSSLRFSSLVRSLILLFDKVHELLFELALAHVY